MIQISVEESAAFDILSILEIKLAKTNDLIKKTALQRQIVLLQSEINTAIGYDLGKKIYRSPHYRALYEANQSVFLQIDKEKSQADKLNYYRFLAKQELQKEFFHKELEEIKLGY